LRGIGTGASVLAAPSAASTSAAASSIADGAVLFAFAAAAFAAAAADVASCFCRPLILEGALNHVQVLNIKWHLP
jgi:hypothetical protein